MHVHMKAVLYPQNIIIPCYSTSLPADIGYFSEIVSSKTGCGAGNLGICQFYRIVLAKEISEHTIHMLLCNNYLNCIKIASSSSINL